jgi:HlyD family secretion protein
LFRELVGQFISKISLHWFNAWFGAKPRHFLEFVLSQGKKPTLLATGLGVLTIVVTVFLWEAPTPQTKSALDGVHAGGPLTSRGYTDALAGTSVIAGDPGGGSVLLELRVKEGQKVKRDEIIAVLSNYSKAEEALRKAEANLTTLNQQHDTDLPCFIGPVLT